MRAHEIFALLFFGKMFTIKQIFSRGLATNFLGKKRQSSRNYSIGEWKVRLENETNIK